MEINDRTRIREKPPPLNRKTTNQIRRGERGDEQPAYCAELPRAAAKRLSCVLGMFSSLEVKVLRPT